MANVFYQSSVLIIVLCLRLLLMCMQVVQSFSSCGGVQNRYVCDTSNPQAFHICLGDNKHSLVCPSTLHFNAKAQICDWPGATACPYDNYAGEYDADVDENAGDYSDSDDNIIDAPSYKTLSPEAGVNKQTMRSVRINPYSNLYNSGRKIYHDSPSHQPVVKEITTMNYDFVNVPNKKIVKGRRKKVYVHNYRSSNAKSFDNFEDYDNVKDENVIENNVDIKQNTAFVHDYRSKPINSAVAEMENDNDENSFQNGVDSLNRRRNVFVHSYRNNRDNSKQDHFDDDVEMENDNDENSFQNGVDSLNRRRNVFVHSYRNNRDNSKQDHFDDDVEMENDNDEDSFQNGFKTPNRRNVFVHSYRNNRDNSEKGNLDDDVENEKDEDSFQNGFKTPNRRNVFVHSYRNNRDNSRQDNSDDDDTEQEDFINNNDIGKNRNPYLHTYRNSLVQEREDGSENTIPKRDSYSGTKRLRKRRRKSKTVSNKDDNTDQTFGESNLEKDTSINKMPRIHSIHRPRSISPYAPPSEAYNVYSHLKRELGLGDNNILRSKHETPVKSRHTNTAPIKPQTSPNHQHKWYQQPYISKVLNELKKIQQPFPGNNKVSNSKPNEVDIISPSSNFQNNVYNSGKQKRIRKTKNRSPYWIDNYNADRAMSHTPNNDPSDAIDDNDDRHRRSHANVYQGNHNMPPQHKFVSKRDQAYDKIQNRQTKKRPYNYIVKYKQPHHQPRQQRVNHLPTNSDITESLSKPLNNHKQESQSELNRSWIRSTITKSKKPVWHPRIRPYRPWRLAELIEDAAAAFSSTKVRVKDTNVKSTGLTQGKQSPSKLTPVPAVSFNGQIIHPYKPKQFWTGEKQNVSPARKYSKSHLTDSKISSYISSIRPKNKKRYGKCSSSWCQLPECRCAGSDIPGGLSRDDTPMMVMLTFDDAVNHINFPYYKEIFDGSRENPNGCPVKGTFFVSGDNTDYGMVRQLTKAGHEIASHTLSHRSPSTWWARAGAENWEREVVGMKNRLAEKSNVPRDSIQGMRAPFLQVGGDGQYIMLHSNKFRYDSSMVTGSLQKDHKPPIWPFTLDTPPNYRTCNLTPCPTKSYPGLWELPLIRWYGNDGVACSMPDACYTGYDYKGTFAFLEDNFQRHYQSNKAPLGIFIHASWFKRKPENFEALKDFLTSLSYRKDVWLLTASQVLDWMQRPVDVSSVASIKSWQC